MLETSIRVLVVNGSLSRQSATRTALQYAADRLGESGATVDVLDFQKEPLALFDPDTSYAAGGYAALKARLDAADALILGTPDYHGSMSSALKNFLDHFWREFAGKLFASVVASHEKGLTVTDQIRTVARQCYAWSLPYGVALNDREDLTDGEVSSESLRKRLEMMARDVRVYGGLLAAQRRADLAGVGPGFMARYRGG